MMDLDKRELDRYLERDQPEGEPELECRECEVPLPATPHQTIDVTHKMYCAGHSLDSPFDAAPCGQSEPHDEHHAEVYSEHHSLRRCPACGLLDVRVTA